MKRVKTFIICMILTALLCGCEDLLKDAIDAISETKPDSETSSSETEQQSPPSDAMTDGNDEDEREDLSSIRKLLKDEDCNVGTVFLGYVAYEATREDIDNLLKNSLEDTYPFLGESVAIVDCGGQELFALVPAEGWSMTVYPVTMSENADFDDHTDTPLYETKANEAIVLRCNVSEIFPDTLVRMTKDGERYDFRPAISLKDGHISETDGCLDLTLYQDYTYENDEVLIAQELLLSLDEVKHYMESGMSLIYTGKESLDGKEYLLFALGTNHEEAFVQEILYGVADNQVYVYDVSNDAWTALGAG